MFTSGMETEREAGLVLSLNVNTLHAVLGGSAPLCSIGRTNASLNYYNNNNNSRCHNSPSLTDACVVINTLTTTSRSTVTEE